MNLVPPYSINRGLGAVLEWLAEQTHEQYGILVDFEDTEKGESMGDDMKILLFQAVRKLLTNVTKHAKTENEKVFNQGDNTHLRVCVEDNGVGFIPLLRGFSPNTNGRFGLFSIKERLNHLGGQFEIESKPSCDTRAIMVAPLKVKKLSRQVI